MALRPGWCKSAASQLRDLRENATEIAG